MSKTLKIEKAERKYAGYHRKFPDKIPTQGMLKGTYETEHPYTHMHKGEEVLIPYLHQEPDGTWTDVDSHLVEIILGSGK